MATKPSIWLHKRNNSRLCVRDDVLYSVNFSMLRTSLCLGILFALIGCGGNTASLSGNVTYEGQPVVQGHIDCLPTQGGSASVGAKIVDGKYRVEGLTPGTRLVQISGVLKIVGPISSADMERKAKEAKGKPKADAPDADNIPIDAKGNNVQIEITAGQQTKDFDLKRPK